MSYATDGKGATKMNLPPPGSRITEGVTRSGIRIEPSSVIPLRSLRLWRGIPPTWRRRCWFPSHEAGGCLRRAEGFVSLPEARGDIPDNELFHE